ncbi:MAG: D-alanyl-lipoteichoic acid biosynthesis protein DltD, partial [Candidatus Levybacteria bacterium]|nr:D-alanyl-lipoteichoic acid biosynthesis protein DltD [Candidatus Levybacteria bacterium]
IVFYCLDYDLYVPKRSSLYLFSILMSQKVFLFTLLFLPIVGLELLLHINADFFSQILLGNSYINYWKQAAPRINYWPDALIIGSSVARQDLNMSILQNEINKQDLSISIGNISHNASSMSHEYLTLKRILKTCKKCPKTIIFQITDIAVKKNEIWLWKESTLGGIQNLYFPDNEIDSALLEASLLDPYYKQYLESLRLELLLRLPFTKGRILSFVENKIYKLLNLTQEDNYEPEFIDAQEQYAYPEYMDEKKKRISMSYGRDELSNYQVGGVTQLFFHKFLNLAKKNNIKVILVVMPQHKDYVEAFDEHQTIFMDFVNKTAKKYNLTLLDHREYNNTNDLIFFDLTHLNIKGASIYSKYIGLQLARELKK